LTEINLRDWDYADRAWVVETSTGEAVASSSGVSHGFLHRSSDDVSERGLPHVTAVYSDGSTLWFQADGQRWDINEIDFKHSYNEAGGGRFSASVRGVSVVDASYPGPLADPVNRNDPTLDVLDIELSDFFYFITRNSQRESWRSSVLAQWDTGITS
jgi:hypothetical protein